METKLIVWLIAVPVTLIIAFFATKMIKRNHDKLFSTEFNFKMAFLDMAGYGLAVLILSVLTDRSSSMETVFFVWFSLCAYLVVFRAKNWGDLQ